MVGLDGDTKNSTFAITLRNKFPESFIECFIAEQNMVGVATGLGCRKKIPFCSTFAAFFSRAADQIRIAGFFAVIQESAIATSKWLGHIQAAVSAKMGQVKWL